MGYACKVLADSVSPDGVRLTTLEVTFPRIVLAEFNTHRMLSRNSASSRAIPVEKRIAAVEADPFIPEQFGKNQKGMQAGEALDGDALELSRTAWLCALKDAVHWARALNGYGVHKQLANRLIEPFCWHTVIVSATEWSNFFALRCHPAAQPEIRIAAELMREAMGKSLNGVIPPRAVNYGDWHMPLVSPDEAYDLQVVGKYDPRKVSIGRCARVSYLTHDGQRDPAADEKLCDDLIKNGHMSPMEHVAKPMSIEDTKLVDGCMRPFAPQEPWQRVSAFCGNLRGWIQYRKQLPREADFAKVLAERGGA